MMKKFLYCLCIVLLPILGGGLDFLRETLRHYTGQTFNLLPITIFYVVANILFMSTVIWLSVQLLKNSLSKLFSLVLLVFGFLIVGEPILFGTGFDPFRFILAFAGFSTYTYLAGAFLFIAGAINILPRKKDNT